jgi:hypothetical protein
MFTVSKEALVLLLAGALCLPVTAHLSLVLGWIEFSSGRLISTSVSTLIVIVVSLRLVGSLSSTSSLVARSSVLGLGVDLLLSRVWHHGHTRIHLLCTREWLSETCIINVNELTTEGLLIVGLPGIGIERRHNILSHLVEHLLLLLKQGSHVRIISRAWHSTLHLLLLLLLQSFLLFVLCLLLLRLHIL